MAFGIDDALSAAAAGIKLTDTLVQTVKAYRKKGQDVDIERLLDEVRVTALQKMDEADMALVQLERTLRDKNVSLDLSLQDAINATSMWRPFEQHRLKRIQKSFYALADATYSATDDIAALVRCKERDKDMGSSVVQSAKAKHELSARLLHVKSIKQAIEILRTELVAQKTALG